MRAYIAFSLAIALTAAGCSSVSNERTYTLQGQVLEVAPDHQQATIKHGDIKGLMSAMTMPYKVNDQGLLNGIMPGDLIDATLVVASDGAYLSQVKKVGQAPLESAMAGAMPMGSSGVDLLKPGDAVPEGKFLDQDGKERSFSAFRGSPLVVTFIYTRCPVPDFCPRMDRQFADLQQALKADAALKTVHLVSISFDPMTDTPPVLKEHASGLTADPVRWTFLTGNRDAIDQFANRFGVTISRSPTDPVNVTHNLRTAIVDADGKLIKVYTGNEWRPEQVLADLRAQK